MEDLIYLQEIQYQREEWENLYVCREPEANRVDVQQKVHKNISKGRTIKLHRSASKDQRRSKSSKPLRKPILLRQ